MSEKKLKITETVLRDAHQSLIATRMRTEDMIPILEKMTNCFDKKSSCKIFRFIKHRFKKLPQLR